MRPNENATKEWRRVKGSLTRAERSGSPERMHAAVRDARATFDAVGWPDWWSRVDRIEADAQSLARVGFVA